MDPYVKAVNEIVAFMKRYERLGPLSGHSPETINALGDSLRVILYDNLRNTCTGMAGVSATKPSWWPKNPYPATIFPMMREDYSTVVPDPKTRTALSGMLGREFWEIASESIWDAMSRARMEEMGG